MKRHWGPRKALYSLRERTIDQRLAVCHSPWQMVQIDSSVTAALQPACEHRLLWLQSRSEARWVLVSSSQTARIFMNTNWWTVGATRKPNTSLWLCPREFLHHYLKISVLLLIFGNMTGLKGRNTCTCTCNMSKRTASSLTRLNSQRNKRVLLRKIQECTAMTEVTGLPRGRCTLTESYSHVTSAGSQTPFTVGLVCIE